MAISDKYKDSFSIFMAVICFGVCTIGIAKPPSILSVRADSREVGLYEKLELRIDVDATFTNPFDPDEIDLRAEFTSPSGKKYNGREENSINRQPAIGISPQRHKDQSTRLHSNHHLEGYLLYSLRLCV